ncbi:N-acetylgalactosaminyltransferase 7 isoform X1 [Schistocerca piceifrons]|uniref:N-acetylgalactosaminyltransferase 7 isoform X1 n=2 Tax=Schistocerca piceifrons TaxID=274613 RepID=UPI001F5FB83C|nr:N-acetylgalactosaminyltransferase 7 isoform X1 [Schistocerca piceifrons]
MRIVQLRKSRVLRVVVVVLLFVPLLYLLFEQAGGRRDGTLNFSGMASAMRKIRSDKAVPTLREERQGRGNFEPAPELPREGAGEGGHPHFVRDDRQNDAQQSLSEYGMNMACSDEISLDRTIPDTRLPECKRWDYPEDLPRTSVIIVFHNEGWSTLMRTVHSVINRTPPQFLEEILLVDDFSDKEDLKTKLEEYITKFDGKVRLVRNKEREGLIRTRSFGAQEARGEVILFLDAHCEVNTNWLPPLLAPIYRDRTVMTVPVIDGIDHKTFEYRPVYQDGHHYRGIFEWGMLYKENELPTREASRRKYNSEPYKSPTHAGGLFAINRKYFLELGAYDPGLLVWGGENFELSFKIWQCGGSIEWVPCSRVGHVYRGFMPYNFGKLAQRKKGPLITINYKRVIETWFDDRYKEFFYTREPLARFLDMGDVTEQLALKKKLNCKSFSWFMENVAYDVLEKYPELPPNLYWGEMRNVATQQCLDTMGHGPPSLMGVSPCHGYGTNQLMRLNTKGQLGVGERCIEADSQGLKLVFCRLGTVDGPWQYDRETRTLLHRVHKKCAALHPQTGHLTLLPCDPNNTYQQWAFKAISPKW